MDKTELILQIKHEYGWDEDVPMSFSQDDLAQINMFADQITNFAKDGSFEVADYRFLQFAETSAYHCLMLFAPSVSFSVPIKHDIENLFETHLYDHDMGEWPTIIIDEREILVIYRMTY